MVKQLIEAGVRLPTVPHCDSIDVIRILCQHGATYENRLFQKYAAEKGDVELLKYLIERDGPKLSTLGDLYPILHIAIREENEAMVQLVTLYYLWDVNTTFISSEVTGESTNLLQIACEEFRLDTVRQLIEQGADPRCPGLPTTASEFFDDYLRNRGYSYQHQPVHSQIKHELAKSEPTHVPSSTQNFNHLEPESPATSEDEEPSTSEDEEPSILTVIDTNTRARLVSESQNVLLNRLKTYPAQVTERPYQYRSLSGQFSTRLILLQPCENGYSPINCQIIHVNLLQAPAYEALSYVWGDKFKQVPISLEGHNFSITLNLWSALSRLRLRDKPRTLWIDAICIDQHNISERNHQVRIMREIYRQAQRVVIWAGEADEESSQVFSTLGKNLEGQWSARSQAKTTALENFFFRPWFYRTWIIQEVSLSQHAVVMCGESVTSWSDMKYGVSFVTHAYHPLKGVEPKTHFMDLQELRNGASVDSILKCSMLCEATDPKDKIYGILGLFRESLIPVDYGLTIAEVFQKFTEAVFRDTRKIEILHRFGTRVKNRSFGLPSWVPDFTISRPVGILPRIDETFDHPANRPAHVLPGMKFDGREMTLSGKFIESIALVGEEMSADPIFAPGSDDFVRVVRSWESLAAQTQVEASRPHSVSYSFMGVLMGDHSTLPVGAWDHHKHTLPDSALDFDALYAQYGMGLLTQIDPKFFEQVNNLRSHGAKGRIQDFTDRVTRYCYGRRFVITDGGTFGLGPPQTKSNDRVVFFPGAWYPFVLRPLDDGVFGLLGDCFLHGFDDYRFLKEIKDGAREFTLS